MTSIQIGILAVVIIVIAAAAILLFMKNRSRRLESRFGPEYERAVREAGSKLKAESRLEKLEKRVESYSIRPLSSIDRDRFQQSWHSVQAAFVDDPGQAFNEADRLLSEVMLARGYPIADFDNRADEISVDHAPVVSNYRAGHEIALHHRQGDATTEELRQGMIHYRALFDELTAQTDRPRVRAAATT